MLNYIIAESGSHGTGKTTAVYNKAAQLKLDCPDKKIVTHVENLAFCPYPINEETTEESQLWIFTNHIQAELFLLTHYDVVVSDRTIVDCIVYTEAAGFKDLAIHMVMLALHHMHRYSQITFHSIENNNYLHEDSFRTTDKALQEQIERTMLKIYAQLGYTSIHPQFDII